MALSHFSKLNNDNHWLVRLIIIALLLPGCMPLLFLSFSLSSLASWLCFLFAVFVCMPASLVFLSREPHDGKLEEPGWWRSDSWCCPSIHPLMSAPHLPRKIDLLVVCHSFPWHYQHRPCMHVVTTASSVLLCHPTSFCKDCFIGWDNNKKAEKKVLSFAPPILRMLAGIFLLKKCFSQPVDEKNPSIHWNGFVFSPFGINKAFRSFLSCGGRGTESRHGFLVTSCILKTPTRLNGWNEEWIEWIHPSINPVIHFGAWLQPSLRANEGNNS